jgi:Uncharacterized protein conserved in archaea
MTSTIEAAIRQQLIDVFGAAQYPVTDPFELLPALPNGAATTFEAGDVTIGAMELGMEYADYQEYPYERVEPLVDDLMTGLRDDDRFS